MKFVRLMAAALLLGSPESLCLATPIVTLSSTPDDLTRVRPGSTFTVSVALAQLESDDQLDSLAATVVFDPALLRGPVISEGEIIPVPLNDPLDFLSLAEPGSVDVAFSTLSTDPVEHIHRDGIFFTFTVEAIKTGSGVISIDLADGTRFNSADPTSPLAWEVTSGTALSFTVIPEPTSAAFIALALVLCLPRRRSTPHLARRS